MLKQKQRSETNDRSIKYFFWKQVYCAKYKYFRGEMFLLN